MENKTDMIDSLKQENCCLKSKFEEMRHTLDEHVKKHDLLQKENRELQFEIKYLKGQIEAYQYALNCKR